MNAPLPWKDIVKIGGFTTAEVARLVGVASASEVASWLRGANPIIEPDYELLHGRLILSFAGLVEARAIAYFLAEDVSRKQMRRVMRELRQRTGERHPLAANKKFVTDGFRAFEKDGDRLVNLANDVYAEPELMKPALHGHVVFDQNQPLYLQPEPADMPLVRIDPRHAFGKPVLVDGGRVVTTAALKGAADQEGLPAAAEWFGVSEAGARQAVAYEQRLAS